MEVISPPMATVANSALMMPPSVTITASGSSAKLVVKAVIRIGLSLERPPCMSAS